MTRFHATDKGNVPFTAEEEAARDAEEAAVLAQQANPTPAPAPTKEQLMAELSALTAKIQALE
jgi:hypothetical protein